MFSGQTPVWVHLYARFRRADSTYRTQQAPRTRYGWRVKALWLVHRDQREPVAVSIAEVRTQRRILFKIGAAKTRRPMLDPTGPDIRTIPESRTRTSGAPTSISRKPAATSRPPRCPAEVAGLSPSASAAKELRLEES
jgi:hypothetical protein